MDGFVTLSFSGAVIAVGQHEGPYTLRNLLVYHKNDVDKGVWLRDAYTTGPYVWAMFDPTSPIE